MRDFERRFNRMWRLISIFIGAIFVFIIAWYLFIGVVGITIIKNPENAAEKVGKTVRKVQDGFNKGMSVENDTFTISDSDILSLDSTQIINTFKESRESHE